MVLTAMIKSLENSNKQLSLFSTLTSPFNFLRRNRFLRLVAECIYSGFTQQNKPHVYLVAVSAVLKAIEEVSSLESWDLRPRPEFSHNTYT